MKVRMAFELPYRYRLELQIFATLCTLSTHMELTLISHSLEFRTFNPDKYGIQPQKTKSHRTLERINYNAIKSVIITCHSSYDFISKPMCPT